jgi:deazaflavin-dependent oxidoreductase (nitroreductase family)
MSRYTKVIRSLGHRRWFAALGRRAMPVDRWLQQHTGGRLTVIGRTALPSLLLTTTGRRSGLPRTVPLLYAADGDRFIVIASNWGQQHHPAWSGNLLATPRATVTVRGRELAVVARLVEGAERAGLWPGVLEVWPAYDTYTERSGREIRVFLLEPVS